MTGQIQKLGLRIVLDWVAVAGDTRSLLPLLRVKTYVASVPTFRVPYKYGLENKYLF